MCLTLLVDSKGICKTFFRNTKYPDVSVDLRNAMGGNRELLDEKKMGFMFQTGMGTGWIW